MMIRSPARGIGIRLLKADRANPGDNFGGYFHERPSRIDHGT
ncbi:MAG: hypothetical protein ABSA93_27365 [Streptosporangiaceae bacterium]